MTPQHSSCTPGMMIPPPCTKPCCENIIVLAHEGAKQHDLAAKCSSIWAISWLRNLLQTLGLTLIHFDQCWLGQHTPKPTTVATNLPLLHWQNLRCNHTEHARPKGRSSADLSRYPWPMMQGLARALLESDFAQGQKPWGSDPSPSDRPVDTSTLTKHGPPRQPARFSHQTTQRWRRKTLVGEDTPTTTP